MKLTTTFFVLLYFLSLLTASPAAAQAISTQAPVEMTVYNSCTDEYVALSGTIHAMANISQDADGNLHLVFVENFHDVTGTGLTSGVSYQAESHSADPWYEATGNFNGVFHTFSSIATVNLISQGSAPNFQVRFITHLTLLANNELTAVVDNVSVTCQ